MSRIPDFGETDDVAVTVLVDNRADLVVKSTDAVKYFTKKPLLAEHGFAALIHLQAAGVKILFDAGISRTALLENAGRMEIDLAAIDQIVLSHGHFDHTTAVTDVLKAIDVKPKPREWKAGTTQEEIRDWVKVRRVPVIAHPAAFRERWRVREDGTRYGPVLPPPREEWEAVGGEVTMSEGPCRLGPGCWTTGLVPRLSFEQSGRPSSWFHREGEAFTGDDVDDDQAAVIHVGGKGLVILSGCAHAGILNTVNYARAISGVDRVWAIMGGFHLAPSTDEEIERTIAEIKGYGPELVAPTHCTGFKAINRFAAEMPEAFVLGVVGATYLF